LEYKGFWITAVLVSLLVPFSVLAQGEVPVLLTQNQIANISIDGNPYLSVRWQLVSQAEEPDVQLYWSNYNDPLTILGQYMIVANVSHKDPLNSLYVTWDGKVTEEGRISLVVRSVTNKPVTVLFNDYVGEVGPYGRPLKTYMLTVAANEGQTYLVYLGGSPKYGFDFILEENATIPMLRIYDHKGELKQNFWITSVMMPYEYGGVGGVGFWVEKVIYGDPSHMVQTMIYGGSELVVKPVEGWEPVVIEPFPFAAVTPSSVEPNQPVKVVLQLPEGASTFTTNLQSPTVRPYISDPVQTYDPIADRHTVTFQFGSEAQGKQFTLDFSTLSEDVQYKSTLNVMVKTFAYMQFLPGIAGGIGLFAFVGLLVFLLRRRAEPLHPEIAFPMSNRRS